MATDLRTGSEPDTLRTGSEPPLTSLVTGILNDFQELMKQQFALFRAEVQSDMSKTKEAATSLALGAGTLVVGAGLLILMVVHLLSWATGMPLWASYGIVGGIFALVGGILLYRGIQKFQSFNPLPDESAQALKENVQCLMNPK